MTAKNVEWTAASARVGSERHRRQERSTRNGWGSKRVTANVGRAVNGDDESWPRPQWGLGPCPLRRGLQGGVGFKVEGEGGLRKGGFKVEHTTKTTKKNTGKKTGKKKHKEKQKNFFLKKKNRTPVGGGARRVEEPRSPPSKLALEAPPPA